MPSETSIPSVGRNIQEKASIIWNVANSLFGAYKPHEYGLVILPMTVVKRFHDCLLPTHQAVLDQYESIRHFQVKDGFLRKASGYAFYNTSPFTFETLRADSENIEDNFRAFINGFSDNVQDILAQMGFDEQIKRMAESNLLYQVIVDFCSEKADMSPAKITPVDMGYIFENLVQRFSESYDEEAGAHFTSRDIIYTMCDLLVADSADGDLKTIYDMTMGTSQMLTCMEERLHQLSPDMETTTFGQELNPFTFGIAKADMLIRGGNPDNMKFGDTLNNDQFDGYSFDYIISNPPFGIDWKREAQAVEAEAKKGPQGRFGAGLPSKSDGQMLFLLNGVAKLKPETGRMAIIQNGSSLFAGDAASGPSEIRRYLIENDWLDAIVQLPNDSFYNTGIATYIWLVTKSKPSSHKGKVLLIDASQCFEPRRKSIGNKRVDITDQCRKLIIQAYGDYITQDCAETLDNGRSIQCRAHLMDADDLGYRKITIESPKREAILVNDETQKWLYLELNHVHVWDDEPEDAMDMSEIMRYIKGEKEIKSNTLTVKRTAEELQLCSDLRYIFHVMEQFKRSEPYYNVSDFYRQFDKCIKKECILLRSHEQLMDSDTEPDSLYVFHVVKDEKGEIKKKKNGQPEPDPSKRDTENVPLKEDVDDYLAREVLPYNPDAWIDKSKTKIGYEIPFTRVFYVYRQLEKAADIAARIEEHEHSLMEKLHALFGEEI